MLLVAMAVEEAAYFYSSFCSPKIPLFRLPKTALATSNDDGEDDDERMLAVAWSQGQVTFGGASGQLYTCHL
jgi:hypothetical protein